MRNLIFLALFVFGLCSRAGARIVISPFDSERQGFIASLSVGPGFTYISSENHGMTGDITKTTIGIVYKLGYAPNDQLVLYYNHRSSVYASKLGDHYDSWFDKVNFRDEKGWAHAVVTPFVLPVIAFFTDQHFLLGPGVTYYLRPDIPSWYFDFGLGLSLLADPYEADTVSCFPTNGPGGYGCWGAVGYEFSHHFQTEIQFMFSGEKWERDGIRKKWTALSCMWTLSVVGY